MYCLHWPPTQYTFCVRCWNKPLYWKLHVLYVSVEVVVVEVAVERAEGEAVGAPLLQQGPHLPRANQSCRNPGMLESRIPARWWYLWQFSHIYRQLVNIIKIVCNLISLVLDCVVLTSLVQTSLILRNGHTLSFLQYPTKCWNGKIFFTDPPSANFVFLSYLSDTP